MNNKNESIKEKMDNIFNKETLLKDKVAQEKQEIINNLLKELNEKESSNGNR